MIYQSTLVGEFMPNPVNAYILKIYINCKPILLIILLNDPELIFLHIVKWFQVLLYISKNLTSVIYLHIEFVLFHL